MGVQVVDDAQKPHHPGCEVAFVAQAPSPLGAALVLRHLHHALHERGDDHVEEPERHEHGHGAVHNGVPPTVGLRHQEEDGTAGAVRALADHDAPEHAEKGPGDGVEVLRPAPTLADAAQGLPQYQGQHVHREHDEHRGPHERAEPAKGSAHHDLELREHIEPQHPHHAAHAEPADHLKQRARYAEVVSPTRQREHNLQQGHRD
mmetsp:Transcript_66122/g.184843  ORF Transcript_66122/g.184843 Transcript_66122/m.184843 type:complete len:204 (-) Transcript_66122:593-1204(-)